MSSVRKAGSIFPGSLSRRDFLKNTSLASLALAAGEDVADFSPRQRSSFYKSRKREIPTTCGMCPANCLVLATVRSGRIVKIEGLRGNPVNGDAVCARGAAALKLVDDPDRLRYPLKRVGPRGSGSFRRISWGEAIDTLSLHLEKTLHQHGPEAVALFAGGPSSVYVRELFREFSVERINDSRSEHCRVNRDLAYLATFGRTIRVPEDLDYEHTRLIFLVGTHLGENLHLPELQRLTRARNRGAKLVVVDPRFSAIAAKADLHLMIRPGTDTALLLGIINELINRGGYDIPFVGSEVNGFAPLRQQASRFDPETLFKLTGIPPEQLARVVEMLAGAAPMVIIHPGYRANWGHDDVDRLRCQAILAALLGGVGVGGLRFDLQDGGVSLASDTARRFSELLAAHQAFGYAIREEIIRGEVKTIGVWGQNPFHALPNPYRTAMAFQKAGFVFACDIYPNQAVRYADLVLPEASFLERTDQLVHHHVAGIRYLSIRQPVVPPVGESRDPYGIVRDLSIRLGRGQGFRFPDIRERIDHELSPLGLATSRIMEAGYVKVVTPPPEIGQMMFPTLSGKVEFSSILLARHGFSAVPEFREPGSPPDGYLRMVSGRSPVHSGSYTQNNPWLLEQDPVNELWIHPDTARRFGLRSGEEVFLENEIGVRSQQPLSLKLTAGIHRECVYLAHGFGAFSPLLTLAYDRGVADGGLMWRQHVSPVSKTTPLAHHLVRLIKRSLYLPSRRPLTDPGRG